MLLDKITTEEEEGTIPNRVKGSPYPLSNTESLNVITSLNLELSSLENEENSEVRIPLR